MERSKQPVGLVRLRHKPTRVDAVEITNANMTDLAAWCRGRVRFDWRKTTWYLRVPTTEGWRPGYIGDWLIFGVLGEFYPVSDVVIRNSYDREGGPVLRLPDNELPGLWDRSDFEGGAPDVER
jgi:hypothetical protein